MRRGFVPEIEMPHLNASCLSWASLMVVGRVSAIHVVLVLTLSLRWMLGEAR